MAEYADSSQLNLWLFRSPEDLALCRTKANQVARKYLVDRGQQQQKAALDQQQQQQSASASPTPESSASAEGASTTGVKSTAAAAVAPPPVEGFACGFGNKLARGDETRSNIETDVGSTPSEDARGHPFLSPAEEAVLVSFYVSKLPSLIGPAAQVPRLRRESKVTATAAMLLRRFFLSNSVMLFDPKTIMVGAAFLGGKVEDATADVRYLEEGTSLMNAPVALQEIIPAEITLLQGTHFDLLCFHPYKAVLALTEDLRTYLKSDKGRALVQSDRPLSGQDLKPIYDTARLLLDDVIVSDIPLLYNPGQVGLAALMVAQERVQEQQQQEQQATVDGDAMTAAAAAATLIPRLDLKGYVKQRFDEEEGADGQIDGTVEEICEKLRSLKEGKYGCGNYHIDMVALKGIHKKLKKVRVWGQKDSGGGGGGDKKKSKKRDKDGGGGGPSAKRQKT